MRSSQFSRVLSRNSLKILKFKLRDKKRCMRMQKGSKNWSMRKKREKQLRRCHHFQLKIQKILSIQIKSKLLPLWLMNSTTSLPRTSQSMPITMISHSPTADPLTKLTKSFLNSSQNISPEISI